MISLTGFSHSQAARTDQHRVDPVKGFFQERLGVADERLFQRLWKAAEHRFGCTAHASLGPEARDRVEKALKETCVYLGKGVSPPGRGGDAKIHQIVQYLLGKGEFSQEWVTKRSGVGVFLRKDPELIRAMQDEFRAMLASCGEILPEVGSVSEPVFHAFISNVIALIPYCYPEEGTEFTIPQKVGGVWKVCTYKVDKKFCLTPKWFSTSISAYGMTSKDGPPLITFLGTTYPMGDGFIATILADFTPGMSVGHAPYILGNKEVGRWLENKEKVRLFGMSLGGALAFHALRHYREKIDAVDTFNAPGLYPWNWGRERYDHGPEVNIYYQDNDLVGAMGVFPEGRNVSVYRVLSDKKENLFKAHACVYTGGDRVTILKSDPAIQNSRLARKILTAVHFLFGTVLVFLPMLCLYLLYLLFMGLVSASQLCLKPSLRN